MHRSKVLSKTLKYLFLFILLTTSVLSAELRETGVNNEKNETPSSESDTWTITEGEIDNKTVQIRHRPAMQKFVGHLDYPRRLTIHWSYKPNDTDMSLPSSIELSKMHEFETKLTDAFEESNAAVITHVYTTNGQREWNFYVRNVESVGEVVNNTLEPDLPIELNIEDDPSWAEYSAILKMISD